MFSSIVRSSGRRRFGTAGRINFRTDSGRMDFAFCLFGVFSGKTPDDGRYFACLPERVRVSGRGDGAFGWERVRRCSAVGTEGAASSEIGWCREAGCRGSESGEAGRSFLSSTDFRRFDRSRYGNGSESTDRIRSRFGVFSGGRVVVRRSSFEKGRTGMPFRREERDKPAVSRSHGGILGRGRCPCTKGKSSGRRYNASSGANSGASKTVRPPGENFR